MLINAHAVVMFVDIYINMDIYMNVSKLRLNQTQAADHHRIMPAKLFFIRAWRVKRNSVSRLHRVTVKTTAALPAI